jgi:hypothetical protein
VQTESLILLTYLLRLQVLLCHTLCSHVLNVIFFARINGGNIGTKKHTYILISGWNTEKRGNFLFAVELLKVMKFYIALHTVFRIRVHMFLGLPDPDPDPFVKGMDPDPDPSVIMQK